MLFLWKVHSTRIYDLTQDPELAAKIRRAKEEKKYMIHFGVSFSLFFPYCTNSHVEEAGISLTHV